MPDSPAELPTEAAEAAITAAHADAPAEDVARGVGAAAKVFTGDPADFPGFCAQHYVLPGAGRDELAVTLDKNLSSIWGNMGVTVKELRHGLDVDDGPLTAADRLFGSFSPAAHLQEDMRATGIAAAIQLNFGDIPDDPDDLRPRTTKDWLEIALTRIGTEAVPAALRQEQAVGRTRADELVNGYNFYLGRIDFGDTRVQFPSDLRLISHWGLRDYMTNLNGLPDALPKQKAILGLMERVVRGRVPEVVLDNPAARWDLAANQVHINGSSSPASDEGSRRWQPFHSVFATQRQVDKYTRRDNLIDTMFLERRRISEQSVEAMLTELLASPLIGRIGAYVAQRIGRPLEPFDIYFKRFQKETMDTEALDAKVRARYPTREAVQADLPVVLEAVGFPAGDARDIASHIRVDNGRGAGHAWPPATRTDQQLLRMRIAADGVVWQEFGTFMHELGHCVEGVLSAYKLPHGLLWGVPATAFSEAFAFTFQDLAADVLGVTQPRDRDVELLQRVWEAFEIAGPALVEMRLFRWLYQHPDSSPDEIHAAIQRIGDETWAEFHAPVFGPEGHGLMSVYSHMLWGDFYLAEYPLGYIIAYQVRRHLRDRDLATEMTRMCRQGSIYPEAWMVGAVGERISVQPMLEDAEEALGRLGL